MDKKELRKILEEYEKTYEVLWNVRHDLFEMFDRQKKHKENIELTSSILRKMQDARIIFENIIHFEIHQNLVRRD